MAESLENFDDESFETVELTEEQQAAREAEMTKLSGEWYQLCEELNEAKTRELELRNWLVQYHFPNGLKEGTNTAELPEGWLFKAQGKINRKVDVTTYDAVREAMKEEFTIDTGELVKYKPELDLKEYRGLCTNVEKTSGEAQKRHKLILATFEQCLIITEGTPQVEMVEPKKKAKVTPKAKVVK